MRRVDHHADDYYPVEPTIAGPLFFEAGPFDHSPLEKPQSEDEKIVANLIFKHQGRDNPIPIAQLRVNTDLSERDVKGIISALRTEHHMPIGARRGSSAGQEETAGYFWIVDARDREIAVAPYRSQILTMWNTLRLLDEPGNLRKLRDQMTVEAQDGAR